MSAENPIEAWAALDDHGRAYDGNVVGLSVAVLSGKFHEAGDDVIDAAVSCIDRTVRSELVALVRAAVRWQVAPPGTAEDASAETALGEAVDALRARLRATMGEP